MAKTGLLSSETIVNVVFGTLACLIAIGGVIATVHAGNKQRRNTVNSEFSRAPRRKHTFHFVRLEALQYFDSDSDDYGDASLPFARMADTGNLGIDFIPNNSNARAFQAGSRESARRWWRLRS
ncbi:hypothetical protein F5Y19DRAFT_478906 [Xylariaceae sp. FL1651]|nr:hypothetical protein F5Y19DRAFT_478906 [Xylariaceae sp. FL1651]